MSFFPMYCRIVLSKPTGIGGLAKKVCLHLSQFCLLSLIFILELRFLQSPLCVCDLWSNGMPRLVKASMLDCLVKTNRNWKSCQKVLHLFIPSLFKLSLIFISELTFLQRQLCVCVLIPSKACMFMFFTYIVCLSKTNKFEVLPKGNLAIRMTSEDALHTC
ncbi:unnamed protein product [Ilex paraguariensis]|uniref:Uncharacterized protein n=1 Tax=Ilex paraguariensis TaxID=185542 RepID=A0ABC8SXL4_9AQUA